MKENGDETLDEKYKKENNEYLSLSTEYLGDIHNVIVNGTYGVQRAKGGMVYGAAGKDKIPAFLSNREFVMSEKAVNMFGEDTLTLMNRQAQGFSKGGLIKPWRGYNTGSSDRSVTFNTKPTTSLADSIKVEPVKIDISGTIKLDLGNQYKDIPAETLLKNDKFIRDLSSKIEAGIRQRWNAANTNVRGGDIISTV